MLDVSIKLSEKMRSDLFIKMKDGSKFFVRPVRKRKKSPLNVKGTDLSLSADEIVDIIREVRER
jgi:L-arabinose isomerase